MKLKPVKASVLSKITDKELKDNLIKSGVVPVNDAFYYLWNLAVKILLLFGGFGSGKSVFIVDKLIKDCLENDYFRCFYGRKIFDTVRNSAFATLCDRIEELNLRHKFDYSRADNSSMVIRCKVNGNSFHPFGADNIDKLKSVKDPSHIYCEELDQFTETDFGILLSRLRTIKTETQFIGAFNTEKVFQDHWIKLAFFSDSEKRHQYANYVIEKVFCNYTDNHFIDHREYEQTLWVSAGFDETKFNSISKGEWGSYKAGSPFIFNFKKEKHIEKGLQPIPNLPIILSFDFNVDPITCLAGQCDGLARVRILDEYRLLNSDIEELCQRIRADYPDKMLLVTGDASGQARTALRRDLNYYKEIKRILQLSMGQFKLPKMNPKIKNTRVLCNALLKNHADYKFSDRVPYLILDIEQTEVDSEGNIDESKDKHKGHLLACFRYFNFTYLHKFLNSQVYEPDLHSETDRGND